MATVAFLYTCQCGRSEEIEVAADLDAFPLLLVCARGVCRDVLRTADPAIQYLERKAGKPRSAPRTESGLGALHLCCVLGAGAADVRAV